MSFRRSVIAILWILLAVGCCIAQDNTAPAAEQSIAPEDLVAKNPLRAILPPDLYAVPGHEINVYFDNILLSSNFRMLHIDADCPRGRQGDERWYWTPAPEDVGDYTLTIKISTPDEVPCAEVSTTVHVVPADAGAQADITILNVGDSLTHAGYYPGELFILFQAEGNPTAKMIGNLTGRVEGSFHEGYGGWQWATFCTRWTDGEDQYAKSPFLRLEGDKPVLDFQAYCDKLNGGVGPDFLTVLLGCNDTFSASDETIEAKIDVMMGYADQLIAEFQRVSPGTQIGICLLVPPSTSQYAFGASYKAGQTRWQYRRNVQRVIERQIEKFAGREDENIFIIPTYVNLDCENNYPGREEPVNARSTKTVFRQNNAVHPAPEGYYQIADSIYYWLKYRLAQQ